MPQYQDLHVFGGVAAGEQRHPAEQPDHEHVEEANKHDRRGEAQVRCSARVLAPHKIRAGDLEDGEFNRLYMLRADVVKRLTEQGLAYRSNPRSTLLHVRRG